MPRFLSSQTIKKARLISGGSILLMSGVSCNSLNVAETVQLRQPFVGFQESGPFFYGSGLASQIETGAAGSGGAAGGGCSSCH